MRQLRLPVGIEDFAEIRRNEYYYVDKTQLIEQVLDRRNKVTLFTRPRRFGKTLNMSMLRYFFEIGTDVKLFEELFIAQNHELCEKYMGKYPVVSISLKSINADSYSKAKAQLIKLVNREGRRVQFLMDSDRLTAVDKALFTALLDREMEEDTLVSSLQELTELLEIHFGQQVIVLKGSTVGADSIVGTGSLLTGKTYDSNSVIAGSPAKIVKQHVSWDPRTL